MGYNFYHAHYKEQRYDEKMNQWRDTINRQGIIVIADNISSAKIKIDECLKRIDESLGKIKSNSYRAVLNSDIVECAGLSREFGWDEEGWTFELNPIVPKNTLRIQ